MNQQQLTRLNVGQNLDDLMNLDPRGYGVCRILYKGAREKCKIPLTLSAALHLKKALQPGKLVYIFTGFVLPTHQKPETDGIVGSILLARALARGFSAVPVLICPEDCIAAARNMAPVAGLHAYDTIEEALLYPAALALVPFTKDVQAAQSQAEELLQKHCPVAGISIEHPGANSLGVYHNAIGKNVTALEDKSDVLFELMQRRKILTIAIGDLGNEMGMGQLSEHIQKHIPYAAPGACACGCGGGICAKTGADHVITATVSDWGCYGLMAALAYLLKDMTVMHDGDMEREMLLSATRNGMVDMNGWLIPAIDGFDMKMQVLLVELMRECISYPMQLEQSCKTWFDKVLELGFFQKENSAAVL